MKFNIYLSELVHPMVVKYLRKQGHELKFICENDIVYKEVCTHADLYMCKLGTEAEAPIFHIEDKSELGFRYPDNVKYNGVCMGNLFIHNTAYTSVSLLEKVKEKGFELLHVKQGYTKCNMVVINDHAAITSDKGIYNSIQKHFLENPEQKRIDVLLIRQGYVELPGFSYGFLGGASGRVSDEIIFNGNLEAHPDFRRIQTFIEKQGLQVKYFPEYPLTDIGSIIASTVGK